MDKETPDDIKLLKAIQEKINTIYDYLKDTERKQERLNADNWRGLDADLRDRISNIMAARSGPNLGKLSDASDDLTKAITAMFSLDQGLIPFNQATHGYTGKYLEGPIANPPGHWIDYAVPGVMTTSGNEPIPNYADRNTTLGAFIWGFYFDVLFRAVQTKIAALVALEPVFRSTAYDRPALQTAVTNLNIFIEKWNRSFLITIPENRFDAAGHINHPYFGLGPLAPTIPLGVIDPVSGVAAFDPTWKGTFEVRWTDGPAYTPDFRLPYVVDRKDALAQAHAARDQMWSAVFDQCGIKKLYDLSHYVSTLATSPSFSEIVRVSEIDIDNLAIIPGHIHPEPTVMSADPIF